MDGVLRTRTRKEWEHVTDHLRALTLTVDATAEAGDVTEKVELGPEARVYCVDIHASAGAVLLLQDSELEVHVGETGTQRWTLPGLRFPAFARFIARAGSDAHLRIVYGNCGPVP